MARSWFIVLTCLTLAITIQDVHSSFEVPELKGCQEKDTFYMVGQTFHPNPCTTCICQDAGDKFCDTIACDVPFCVNGGQPSVPYGECCPVCPEENNADEEQFTSSTTPPAED